MSTPRFVAGFPQGILKIASSIDKEIDQLNISKNLRNTQCLCACLFRTVIESIRGCFSCLEVKSVVACKQIGRSILEHMIDMKYIALENSDELNSLFINFHKLKKYFLRHQLTTYRNQIPIIEREYRDYVLKTFSDVIEDSSQNGASLLLLPDWQSVDKKIKKKFRSSWSGIDFPTRVGKIEERLREIHNVEKEQSLEFEDPMIDFAKYWFNQYSHHLHPSVFGSIPHFNPSDSTFQWKWSHPIEAIHEEYNFLGLCLSYAHDGFGYSFNSKDQRMDWRRKLVDLFEQEPTVSNWYFR